MNATITFNSHQYEAVATYNSNEVEQVVPGSTGLFNTVTVWTFGTAADVINFTLDNNDGTLDTKNHRNMTVNKATRLEGNKFIYDVNMLI